MRNQNRNADTWSLANEVLAEVLRTTDRKIKTAHGFAA
jgi:hypothetical protein